jgi:ribosome biogenesis protein UTP30
VQRESGGLLEDEEPPIHVLMATKQMPKAVGKAKACKPVPLKLPHPYVSLDSAEICLITKDPQREFKDKLADAGLTAKVIGVSKLKKKYHPYEAKRQLMASYKTFLADTRVLPILPPLLGKAFFAKKRLPTGVDLKKKDLRAELERAACGTVYRHANGTSNSIQVGTAGQSPDALSDNVVAAVEQVVEHIQGKWTNVQSLSLRTTNSVALPFYSSLPHA